MDKEKYSKEELYEMLWKKAEKVEKIPTAREFNNDPFLPNFKVFNDCFGDFRKSTRLKNLVAIFTELNKKNNCFCIDCPEDENKCKKDVLDCKVELSDYEFWLYFVLFDKIIC